MIQIKNKFTGEVLKQVNSASLQNANLRGADLEGAILEGAILRGAILQGAYLYSTGLYQFVGGGSVGRCVTYDSLNDRIIAGCFYDSLEAFKEAVINKYSIQHEYITWVEMCQKHFKR